MQAQQPSNAEPVAAQAKPPRQRDRERTLKELQLALHRLQRAGRKVSIKGVAEEATSWGITEQPSLAADHKGSNRILTTVIVNRQITPLCIARELRPQMAHVSQCRPQCTLGYHQWRMFQHPGVQLGQHRRTAALARKVGPSNRQQISKGTQRIKTNSTCVQRCMRVSRQIGNPQRTNCVNYTKHQSAWAGKSWVSSLIMAFPAPRVARIGRNWTRCSREWPARISTSWHRGQWTG